MDEPPNYIRRPPDYYDVFNQPNPVVQPVRATGNRPSRPRTARIHVLPANENQQANNVSNEGIYICLSIY